MLWLMLQFSLVVLQVPSASPTAADVYPARTNGFAAEIVPALLAVAVLALFAIWLSSKPKRGKTTGRANKSRRRSS